jgi:hypothetical protein
VLAQEHIRTWSSAIDPDIEPIAQQSVFKLFHDHSSPFSCLLNFFNIYQQNSKQKQNLYIKHLINGTQILTSSEAP